MKREWLPIETYKPIPGVREMVIVGGPGYSCEAYFQSKDDGREGWYLANTHDTDYSQSEVEPPPTHWMRMPDPPSAPNPFHPARHGA